MRDTEPEIPMRALPPAEETRRRRALHQELAVRAGVALLMLIFNELFTVAPAAGTYPAGRAARTGPQ